MPTITSLQYQAAFGYAIKVQGGVLSSAKAAEHLVDDTSMGDSSANDYLIVIKAMMDGHVYKRTIKINAFRYYLKQFHRTMSSPEFKKVINAIEMHLEYYSSLGNGNQPTVRALVDSYRAKLASQAISPVYPDEVPEPPVKFTEGAVRQVTINAYERDPKARAACIEEYGSTCQVCKFNFETAYGAIGKGFIHVHHKIDIATVGESYQFDPINDLIPVCPNCHAMLHTDTPAMSIEKLKQIIQGN